MEWLFAALREPGAQLVQVVGLLLVAALQQRIRGKKKALRGDLEAAGVIEPKPSVSYSNTPS